MREECRIWGEELEKRKRQEEFERSKKEDGWTGGWGRFEKRHSRSDAIWSSDSGVEGDMISPSPLKTPSSPHISLSTPLLSSSSTFASSSSSSHPRTKVTNDTFKIPASKRVESRIILGEDENGFRFPPISRQREILEKYSEKGIYFSDSSSAKKEPFELFSFKTSSGKNEAPKTFNWGPPLHTTDSSQSITSTSTKPHQQPRISKSISKLPTPIFSFSFGPKKKEIPGFKTTTATTTGEENETSISNGKKRVRACALSLLAMDKLKQLEVLEDDEGVEEKPVGLSKNQMLMGDMEVMPVGSENRIRKKLSKIWRGDERGGVASVDITDTKNELGGLGLEDNSFGISFGSQQDGGNKDDTPRKKKIESIIVGDRMGDKGIGLEKGPRKRLFGFGEGGWSSGRKNGVKKGAVFDDMSSDEEEVGGKRIGFGFGLGLGVEVAESRVL